MTIQQIYKLALEMGVSSDFRSKKEIGEFLELQRERYDALSKDEKEYFDKEKLTNPYSDTRIHFDSGKKDIKRIFASIDATPGSIYIAEELHGDLIINHHPVGLALAGLDDVMYYQVDQMEKIGVPIAIAEKLIHRRISEVARGINPVNHYATVDAARLMKISFMNVHTPGDNLVAKFVSEKIERAKPKYVKDVWKAIMTIPEYQEATRQGSGPMLFSGSKNNRCGRVVVSEMTGGTEGSKEIYQAMAQAGVGTIVSMHQSEDHRKAAEEAHINVIVAGHISSDSIGMNLFLDELEKKGMEIVPFGGLIRVRRNKKR
ncbi:MAG TPA: NGG1p interacting factor NIF3 [Patescibacteria group bacterium]|nr:NGG1p interacting factor NIF3 [Patescibacteria group bacterium]